MLLPQQTKLDNCLSKGRCGGLFVSALDSRSRTPGSNPWLGHCVVFLGQTLNSQGASLYPGVELCTSKFNAKGGTLQWTNIPSRGKEFKHC